MNKEKNKAKILEQPSAGVWHLQSIEAKLALLLLAGTLAFCACRGPVSTSVKNDIELTIATDVPPRGDVLPDIKLTARNRSSRPAKYRKIDEIYTGNVVLQCRGQQFVLKHRVFWNAISRGQYAVPYVTLAPGEALEGKLSLQSDFFTREEYAARGERAWIERDIAKNCGTYTIYCDDPELGLRSNSIVCRQ